MRALRAALLLALAAPGAVRATGPSRVEVRIVPIAVSAKGDFDEREGFVDLGYETERIDAIAIVPKEIRAAEPAPP